jgi:hypothetical protein
MVKEDKERGREGDTRSKNKKEENAHTPEHVDQKKKKEKMRRKRP